MVIVRRVRAFDEWVKQQGFGETSGKIKRFISLSEANDTFRYRMGGVSRRLRWGFEGSTSWKGDIVKGFNDRVG